MRCVRMVGVMGMWSVWMMWVVWMVRVMWMMRVMGVRCVWVVRMVRVMAMGCVGVVGMRRVGVVAVASRTFVLPARLTCRRIPQNRAYSAGVPHAGLVSHAAARTRMALYRRLGRRQAGFQHHWAAIPTQVFVGMRA